MSISEWSSDVCSSDLVRDVRADALRGQIGIHIGFDFSGMPCTTCALQDPCVAGLARTVVDVDDRDSIRLEAEGLASGKVVHDGHVGDPQKRYRGGMTGVGRKVGLLHRSGLQRWEERRVGKRWGGTGRSSES